MIKKINKFLLLYFPLVWNTRAFWMFLILLGLHFIFYCSGWWYFDGFKRLQGVSGSTSVVSNANFAYALIISVLLIIVWLVYYLRNNPFKSFYPLVRGYFAMEFCIIFLIMMGFITLPETYARGFYDAIEHNTKEVNLTSEVNTLNLAFALIPQTASDYASHNCCDSLEYRNSQRYLILKAHEDSMEGAEARSKEGVYAADGDGDEEDSMRQRKHPSYYDYSYLNFCRQYSGFYDSAVLDRKGVSAKIQWLLTSGNKAEVAAILKRFEDMCIKYRVEYTVNIPSYTNLAFKDERHSATRFLNENDETATITRTLDFAALDQVLTKIHNSRHRDFEPGLWVFNLFFALFLALALYSFRLSSTRIWLISLVAAGVILIIYGISVALIRGDYFALCFAIALVILFYLLFHFMRSARRKTVAGVSLVLFSWSFPGLLFLIQGLVSEITRPKSIYNPLTFTYTHPASPVYSFLEDHEVLLYAIYFVVNFLVVVTVLYRHYRSWQAIDEE